MTRRRSLLAKGVAVRRRRRRRSVPWEQIVLASTMVSGVLAIVLGAGWGLPRLWSAVRAHPYFAVTEITVRASGRVGRQQLLSWAGVRRGMSVWDADPAQIRLRLLTHSDLGDAQVRRDFPRRLVIFVRERVPVAIAVLDELYFVDRAGQVMAPLHDGDSRDLPLITGLHRADVEHGGSVLLRRAARLVRFCQRDGCGDGVSEINVDARKGVTLIPLRQPVAIRLGWGGWRTKLARTTRVLAAWEGQESRLALLDATFPGEVIVRMRPVPVVRDALKRRTKVGVRI